MPFDANDPETKAAIEAIKADFTDKLETEQAKNRGLLDDFKKAQNQLRAKDGIEPADLEKAEAEAESWKAKATAAEKAARDAGKLAETASKALEVEQKVTHRLIAENGLVEELTKAGVTDPAYLDACKALHMGNVSVVADGDGRKALYGDKPLSDAIKEWSGSDIGKRFVAAPVNGGGGAQGGGGDVTGKTMSRTAFDALDHGSRATFAKGGGKVVDEAA